jgi:predicted PurR-regulated permease PerM
MQMAVTRTGEEVATAAPSPARRTRHADPAGVLGTVPGWLRTSGLYGWLFLGLAGALVVVAFGVSFLDGLVTPLLYAAMFAIVFYPFVDWMQRHRVPRPLGALITLLLLLLVGLTSVWVVIRGVMDQAPEIREQLDNAVASVTSWLASLGIEQGSAEELTRSAEEATGTASHMLLSGIASGLAGISSFFFMVFVGSMIFLFLVMNGARYAGWMSTRTGLPPRVAEPVFRNSGSAIRGYFAGTTIIALSNAVPVGLTALLLDVPLAGSIAIVTFITAYVPFFGAIVAGAFAVLIALGTGVTEAVVMLVVILLVNNVLQNFFAPFAYSASLNLDPLVALLVTTAAGLVGGVGLIMLAAPLTAIVIQTAKELNAAAESAPEETTAEP